MSFDRERFGCLVGKGLRSFDLMVDPRIIDLFAMHAEYILEWNRKVNLTAITDPLGMAEKHFIDSLVPCSYFDMKGRLLDTGSGAGFPGMPLAVFKQNLSVSLLDARRKKTSFLSFVSRQMGLENIEVINQRIERVIEGFPRKAGFDIVISRAFSKMPRFFSLALRLVKDSGIIIAMQAHIGEDEMESISDLLKRSGRKIADYAYKLPFTGAERRLVAVMPKGGSREHGG